jgi:hydrogenase maturation protease HycI
LSRRILATPPLLVAALRERLGEARSVALLAVGSDLRKDDAAGLLVGRALDADPVPRLTVVEGSTAPESVTGVIRTLGPSHLLVVDAAEFGETPGSIALIDAEDVAGTSFSTHMLPLAIVLRYLVEACPGLEVLVLGIEPTDATFGFEQSPPVLAAVDVAATAIREALR